MSPEATPGSTRIALVTGGGAAAERLRVLLPFLEEFLALRLFVDGDAAEFAGRDAEPATSLASRDFDQILYFLENLADHAFMLPMIRDLGGTVVLHDWSLGELAVAAAPALGQPGFAGQVAAWREGGLRAFFEHRRRGAASALENLPLNRSVVRHADAFVVPEGDWRRWILEERNAPTPVAVIPWTRGQDAAITEASASRFRECLALLPTHRTNRKSLIPHRHRPGGPSARSVSTVCDSVLLIVGSTESHTVLQSSPT